MKFSKLLSVLLATSAASGAFAAQFQPSTGGDIDDPKNWNGTGTMAVMKEQSGPLTISKSPASMPAGATELDFRTYSYDCDFGAGSVLDMGTVKFNVEHGGRVTLKSGTIKGPVYVQNFYNGTSSAPGGTLVLDGENSVVEPTTFAIVVYKTTDSVRTNTLIVTNGAKLAMSGKSFTVYGGFNAGYALFTGVGSTLEAKDIYMGGKFDGELKLVGWNDQPGVPRTVEFANGATNAITGSVYLGCNEISRDSVSGGNTLKVSSDAQLTVGSLFFGPSADSNGSYVGSTNNSVVVDGGTLKVRGDVYFGRDVPFKGNRLEVKGGGRLELTDEASALHALQVGMASDGESLSVEGEGSVLDMPLAKLFVGGRSPYASSGNRVEVRDGGRIQTGMDAYLGLMGGHDNRLALSGNAEFESTENLYMSGPTSVLEIVGSEFSLSKILRVDSAAIGSSIVLGEGSILTVGSLDLKVPTAFSATGSTLNVPVLALADDSSLFFTNSTLSIHKVGASTLGCNGGTLSFHGGSVLNLSYSGTSNRLTLGGDDFTLRLDDSTLDATGITSDWFLTGTLTTDGSRSIVFEGARPYLKTADKGFYLRGSAITLEFNLGSAGFPTDRPVIDVGTGAFGTDAGASKSAHLVSVNVSGDCPEGTYVLMRGTDAGKFLNADRYVLTCEEGRKAKLIRTDNEVSVQVKEIKGLLLIFR